MKQVEDINSSGHQTQMVHKKKDVDNLELAWFNDCEAAQVNTWDHLDDR